MKISTRGRYALRIMIELASRTGDEFVSIRDISEKQDISVKYLEQIVSLLNKAGMLIVARGVSGGYKLARKKEEYTLGEILRCTEGNLAPVNCLCDENNVCPKKNDCVTLPVWQGLYDTINDYLDSITLDKLIRQEETYRLSAHAQNK